MMRRLMAVGLVLALAGCAAKTTTADPTTTQATTTAPTTAAPTSTAPVDCTPATPDDTSPIESNLIPPAATIGEANIATSGDLTYLGANIYGAGGDKVSSADVWVKKDGRWYTLSGGARDNASELLGDGRELPEAPSAGDETATAVQACT